MLSPSALLKGIVSRVLPSPTQDLGPEAEGYARLGRYRDLKVESAWPTDHLLSDEGAYMVAAMGPAQAALNLGIQSSFVATGTKAAIVLGNSDSPGGRRLYPKFLRLVPSIAPTSGTSLRYAIVLDSKDRTPTTISNAAGAIAGPGTPAANTAYRAPVVCTNMDVTPNIVGVPFFPLSTAAATDPGAPTVPAAGPNARTIVGNGILKASIPVVLDQYILQFGGVDHGGTFQAAAALAKITEHAPAVVVGPGQFLVIYLWAPSNITAGLTVDDLALGWIEK